jgi:hypothetical protein
MFKRLIIFLAVIGLLFGFNSQAYSTFSNGTLIKGSGPEVYIMEYGLKRWIPTPAVFQSLFLDWNKIKRVTDDLLNSFPNGNKMSSNFSEGALLKSDKNAKVYLNDNNKLRWVPDPYVFNSNNFSWENITTVTDATINWRTKGTDVRAGEFTLLPTTFIITKPPAEVNLTKLTFVYSGTNPTGPTSDLVWETFLDGFDAAWQYPSSTFTRVVTLPGVNKTYTFYVRSKNKDGKVDDHPASYSFKLVGFSPEYVKLKISGVKYRGVTANDEYVKITNNTKINIDATGLVIKNKQNETINIPQSVENLSLGGGDMLSDIILAQNKSVTIFSSSSPVGKNFRLNDCTGYLNNYYTFTPKLPERCPKPIDQDLIGYSKSCRDYINALPACAAPNTGDLRIAYDSQCVNYLMSNLNYSSCVLRYQAYPSFLKDEWYVYINRSSGFLNDTHDEVKLLDKDGNLIDTYSY